MAVLDRDLRVMVWNHHAEELWGLRADEARPALPHARHRAARRAARPGPARRSSAAASARPARIDAVNRRGRAIVCSVTVLPLVPGSGDGDGDVRGAIVLMEGFDGDGREPQPRSPAR